MTWSRIVYAWGSADSPEDVRSALSDMGVAVGSAPDSYFSSPELLYYGGKAGVETCSPDSVVGEMLLRHGVDANKRGKIRNWIDYAEDGEVIMGYVVSGLEPLRLTEVHMVASDAVFPVCSSESVARHTVAAAKLSHLLKQYDMATDEGMAYTITTEGRKGGLRVVCVNADDPCAPMLRFQRKRDAAEACLNLRGELLDYLMLPKL